MGYRDASAVQRLQEAIKRGLEPDLLHSFIYCVSFLKDDKAQMERDVAYAKGKPVIEGALLNYQADTEAFFGHLARAQELSRRAAESAGNAGQNEAAAQMQMNAALREAEFGGAAQARKQIAATLALNSTPSVQILAALALARAGDIDHAQTLAQEVRKQKPLSTELNGYWLPAIEGSIAIQRKNPSKAIELLQATAPHELGNPTPQFALSATFYPIYVPGQAYLASHQGAEATAEFQKFIDHRSIVMNYPLTALAHLGLARAYAMQGETTKARAAYQDFFTLWKDADPDIPVLQQAKDEAAALP